MVGPFVQREDIVFLGRAMGEFPGLRAEDGDRVVVGEHPGAAGYHAGAQQLAALFRIVGEQGFQLGEEAGGHGQLADAARFEGAVGLTAGQAEGTARGDVEQGQGIAGIAVGEESVQLLLEVWIGQGQGFEGGSGAVLEVEMDILDGGFGIDGHDRAGEFPLHDQAQTLQTADAGGGEAVDGVGEKGRGGIEEKAEKGE